MKAKKITEIHSEAEKNLGLRPGATAVIRNNRALVSGSQGNISPMGFPMARPGTGGMMPGMPGTRKMPGMPGMDNDNWEVVPRGRAMPKGDGLGLQPTGRGQSPLIGKPTPLNSKLLPQGSAGLVSGRTSALLQGTGGPPTRPSNAVMGPDHPLAQTTMPANKPAPVVEKPIPAPEKLNLEDLKRKTHTLLEDYFDIGLLDEALHSVKELKSPAYHPEVVKEAISLSLEKNPPRVEQVAKLLDYLLAKSIITPRDIGTGCLLYGSMLDDIGIDLPKAPNNFGEIIGKLILANGLDFKVVKEILKKVEDDMFQKAIFDAAIRVFRSSPFGSEVLDSQGADIEACESLF